MHVLFYDGVCRFCSGIVQTALRSDRAELWRFAPLQGETAAQQLPPYGVDPADLDRIYALLDYGTPRQRLLAGSDAGAALWSSLAGPPRLLGLLLRLCPRPVHEALYGWIARRRYRIFGRHEQCRVPDPALAARFLP